MQHGAPKDVRVLVCVSLNFLVGALERECAFFCRHTKISIRRRRGAQNFHSAAVDALQPGGRDPGFFCVTEPRPPPRSPALQLPPWRGAAAAAPFVSHRDAPEARQWARRRSSCCHFTSAEARKPRAHTCRNQWLQKQVTERVCFSYK